MVEIEEGVNQSAEMDENEAEAREQDKCWEAFMAFDHEHMGFMATADLKNALEYLGETVTDEETFLMIANVDPENTGSIQYA